MTGRQRLRFFLPPLPLPRLPLHLIFTGVEMGSPFHGVAVPLQGSP